MPKLSPAAQAVSNSAEAAQYAYWNILDKDEDGNLVPEIYEMIAAAAIRAAADQVVPAVPFDRRCITEERWDERDDIRAELLGIAAELDGTND